jgi:phenol 2-monooxygenase
MNVSMMDAYNLSWKLAHNIIGLTPRQAKGQPDPVLETFDQERVDTARLLIDFDKKFSHMFSGQIGAQDSSTQGMSQAEFQSIFTQGNAFTSGCGLHYRPSTIVDDIGEAGPLASSATDSQSTHLETGRRLLNVELKRYADGSIRQLHDGRLSSRLFKLKFYLTRSCRNRFFRPIHAPTTYQHRST